MYHTQKVGGSVPTVKNSMPLPKSDKFALQQQAPLPADTAQEDWEKKVKECFEKLEKSLSGTNVHIVPEQTDVIQYAASLKGGVHVIISRDFLLGMAASEEAFQEGTDILTKMTQKLQQLQQTLLKEELHGAAMGVAVDDEGTVCSWLKQPQQQDSAFQSMLDALKDPMVKYYKEKGGRNVTEIKTKDGVMRWVITKKLNYNPGKDLAKLAAISAITGVNSFVVGVRARLKCAKNDPYLDENEVKQAVYSMERMIQRANTKVKQLKEENQMEKIKKRMQQRQEMKKAQYMARELKRRRTLRRSKEYGQIHERFPLPPSLDQLHRKQDEREEKWEESFIANSGIPTTQMDMELMGPGYGAQASPAPAPSSVDVII